MLLSQLQSRVLFTLAYTDQFLFPLTETEVVSRLVAFEKKSPSPKALEVKRALHLLEKNKLVQKAGNLYVLGNRIKLVEVRKRREQTYIAREKEIRFVTNVLKLVPGIAAAFLTGSLAMKNAELDDDLDLFVICQKNRLWTARFVTICLSWVLGKKKGRKQEGKGGWCFNLWLDEKHLEVPLQKRGVYQAYEVVQARFLTGSKKTLAQFYSQNQWLEEFLPNSWKEIRGVSIRNDIVHQKGITKITFSFMPIKKFISQLLRLIFNTIETGLFTLQITYMHPHQTTERVGRGFAFFHPRPTANLVRSGWLVSIHRLGSINLDTMAKKYASTFFPS